MPYRRLAATLSLTLATSAAMAAAPADAGRRFPVGRFDAITLESSDSVRVVTGDGFAVSATGDPRAVAALDITVHGDTLHIDRRPGSYRDRNALVTVTMPRLRAATISGSGDFTAGPLAGAGFTADLNGSGNFRLTGLDLQQVRFSLSGSGGIHATGRARSVAIDLGGSGNVDTTGLTTPTLEASLGGSGEIAATAERAATIDAGGSGSVRIVGHPRCSVHRSGSASVRCD